MKRIVLALSFVFVTGILAHQSETIEQTQKVETRQVDCLFATAQVDRFTLTISTPGTYCLIEDFDVPQGRAAGFIITSDDVLLDLNGHILTGVLSNNSVGIIIRPANNITAPRNITVRNGTLAFMRNTGILINTAFGVTIDSIFFLADATGILANNMTRSQISNCFFTLATNNGITFNNVAGSSSQSVTITNCKSYNNTVNGFSLNNCLNFQLFNCIATGNGVNGFTQLLSNQCDYQECIANTNGTNGFFISGNSNSLEQCQAKGNGAAGFIFGAPSTQGQVRDNIATGNAVGFQNNGAVVPAANANRFYANFANNNGPTTATNFVNIANFFVSPIPATPINFTTNISN